MSDRPDVKTQAVRRDELAAVLRSPRLVKAFEHLADDVGKTLPDAAEITAQTAAAARTRADAAKEVADHAQADATDALDQLAELDTNPAAQIAAMREQITALWAVVHGLQQGVTA